MEIPEYLKVLLFAVVTSFVVYALEPAPVNVISAPISNFTNITRTISYTVQAGDNITQAIYFYGSVSNMSKHTGLSKEEIVKQLLHSRVFVITCTGKPNHKFGDPFIPGILCDVFGEKVWLG